MTAAGRPCFHCGEPADAMIALHARRSAQSIAAWAESRPRRPLAVVLTGTDLYRDIRFDADAKRSLQLATHPFPLSSLSINSYQPLETSS